MPSTDSHVYQYTRPIRSLRRSSASIGSPSFRRSFWPFSVVSKPPCCSVLPCAAGHESSVIHTGIFASLRRAISRRTIFTIRITFFGIPV